MYYMLLQMNVSSLTWKDIILRTLRVESVVCWENELRRKENKQHLKTGERVKGDKGCVEEFMQDYQE